MNVLIALPNSADDTELALTPLCGVPLLVRVLATAAKAGANEFMLLEQSPGQSSFVRQVLNHPLLAGRNFTVACVDKFDPETGEDWKKIGHALPPLFLWLPWNLLLSKSKLQKLLMGCTDDLSVSAEYDWQSALVLHRSDVLREVASRERPRLSVFVTRDSFLVRSVTWIPAAQRYLVRQSGKETDGLYSRLNRRMCWSALALICETRITPNAVTLLGLLLSVLSGYFFAQGHWSAYVLGALAYFACVLCDEMDGMLARLTFSDSALGCWLETVADYASYVFLFVGLTIGLYRQSGRTWLWTGLLTIAGSIMVMLVLSYQRKIITDPNNPQEFRKKLQRTLERDSSNPIAWLGRNLEFMIRKPAYCYWVLLFCTLGLTKLFVFLTAFGANVAWMMALSYNRLFQPIRSRRTALGGQQS